MGRPPGGNTIRGGGANRFRRHGANHGSSAGPPDVVDSTGSERARIVRIGMDISV